ncbi:MAG: rhodanese-like domain-containing protein [Gammaproteobacteria bacterium]|nr:rhodanese-like domain-containing protein [Gammaproteobacteria bacterium]MCP5298745.1 rhodanese-like domain-containing protein [Chromatiaceae bacterium]
MNTSRALLLAAAAMLAMPAIADNEMQVRITPTLSSIDVKHQGKTVRIQRNQDQDNVLNPAFQRTSRRCPPFCVQPMHMPEGVETIGELEMLDYLRRAAGGDSSILIIDSRGPDWLQRGTIPGSVNIHYKRLSVKAAGDGEVAAILHERFDAERDGELWDFRFAKTLVLFCNGSWCGQSPSNIRVLLRLGYPPSKIKWYRGGMQAWEAAGLTTVVPEE